MLLFYSINCPHCIMLLNTIRNYEATKKLVKFVCIENVLKTNPVVLNKICSVPSLMLMPSKTILKGKEVFDYLILPNKGILVTSLPSNDQNKNDMDVPLSHQIPGAGANAGVGEVPSEPMPTTHIGSDTFGFIDDAEEQDLSKDKTLVWEMLDDPQTISLQVASKPVAPSPSPSQPVFGAQIETRTKKELPDLDIIRARREQEMK